MQTIITTTIYLLTTLIPLIFSSVNFEIFEFPKFILLLTGTGVITIAWFIHAVLTRDWQIVPPSSNHRLIHYSILGVLATQAMATIFSIHPYTSFWGYYSRFHQGLLTTICYTIIYFAIVKWFDYSSTRKLIRISLITAAIVSVIAILEHYDCSITCILMTAFNHFRNAAFPFIQSTACWGKSTNPLDRSFATIGQPNWLAAYLLLNLPLALSQIITQPLRKNYLYYLFIILYTLALLFTKSRSGFIALALSLVYYCILVFKNYSFKDLRTKLLSSLVTIFSLCLLFGTPFTSPISVVLGQPKTELTHDIPTSTTVIESGGTESGDLRKIVWTGALQLIAQHPIFGTGPETFAYTYYWVRPIAHNYTSEWDFLYNKAHNEYLNMAATTGIIGLSGYLFWHFALGKLSFRRVLWSKKTNKDKEDLLRSLLPAMGAALISFFVTNFFGFSVIPVYLLMVIFSALPSALTNTKTSDLPYPAPSHLYAYSLIIVFIYFLPLRLFRADYYYNLGKQKNSLEDLEKAVALRPYEDLYHSSLAESYASLTNQNDAQLQAIKHAQFTFKHNPYHLNYYKSRVKVYLAYATRDQSFYAASADEFVRARELAPTDPKLAYNLGLIYSRVGDIKKAETQIRQAIELKKDYQEAYYALTLLFEQTKQETLIPELLRTAQSNLSTYSATLQEKFTKYLSSPEL